MPGETTDAYLFSDALYAAHRIQTSVEQNEKYGAIALLETGKHPLNLRFGDSLPHDFRMGFVVAQCRSDPWDANASFDFGEHLVLAPPAQLNMPSVVHPMTAHELAHINIGEGDVKYIYKETSTAFIKDLAGVIYGSQLSIPQIIGDLERSYLNPGFLEGEIEAARVECLTSMDLLLRAALPDGSNMSLSVMNAHAYHLAHHARVFQSGLLRLGSFLYLQQQAVDAVENKDAQLHVTPSSDVVSCEIHIPSSEDSADFLFQLEFNERPLQDRLRAAIPYVAERLQEEGFPPDSIPEDLNSGDFGSLLTTWHVVRHDMLPAYRRAFNSLSTIPVSDWMGRLLMLLDDMDRNIKTGLPYGPGSDEIIKNYRQIRAAIINRLDSNSAPFDPFRESRSLSVLDPRMLRHSMKKWGHEAFLGQRILSIGS